ncbi:MAG: MATE family efflux transporter [Christensenellaceae bacterium]|nr:MATE family efflux transporter [Christensenellaceae bacterium]
MTEGSIIKHLISFAIPLLLGNVFQQLYNTVDSWVVGNYVSDEAFSAVGTVGPIINLLIGFFLGLSTGAGVVISQYYGAKQNEKVQNTVHTAILMTLLLGIAFTVIGVVMTPLMLDFMDTPAEVIPEATLYLQIYFSGMLGLMLYNMGSGILRAVGDSQRPFLFLVVSAVTNTILDLVFVLVFHMGVEGVALATIIAQFLSAVLTMYVLMRSDNCCKLIIKKLRIHWDMLKKILKIGIPAAIQMAITSFSNVFVQSYINHFGSECMGGWTAYSKIDQFLLLPMQSISLAATTFVGQNLGVGQVERSRKGVRTAILISVGCTAVLMIPVLLFAGSLVEFFNSNPEVVDYGAMLLRLISPFYIFCCINQIYAGALRGAGDSRSPMFIMVGCFVVFRQIYLYVVSNFVSNTITAVALGYPAGWLLCSLITFLYFRFSRWDRHRIVE